MSGSESPPEVRALPENVKATAHAVLSTASAPPPQQHTPLHKRAEYLSFKAAVQKHRVTVVSKKASKKEEWVYYDMGPKDAEPLIFIPGTSATADVFFYQLMTLGSKGFRIISCQYPAYGSVSEWLLGFNAFLLTFHFPNPHIHLFGNSLGGYLALHFLSKHKHIQVHVELKKQIVVESVILCNSFADVDDYQQSGTCVKMLSYMPEFALKRYILDAFPRVSLYPEVIDFMVEQFETLKRDEVASRILMHATKSKLDWTSNLKEKQNVITIIESMDENVLPSVLRARLLEHLPEARHAQLKEGGDFPFLANPAEINLFIQIHFNSWNRLKESKEDTDGAATSSESTAATTTTTETESSQTSSGPNSHPSIKSTPVVSQPTHATPPSASSSVASSLTSAPASSSSSSGFSFFKPTSSVLASASTLPPSHPTTTATTTSVAPSTVTTSTSLSSTTSTTPPRPAQGSETSLHRGRLDSEDAAEQAERVTLLLKIQEEAKLKEQQHEQQVKAQLEQEKQQKKTQEEERKKKQQAMLSSLLDDEEDQSKNRMGRFSSPSESLF